MGAFSPQKKTTKKHCITNIARMTRSQILRGIIPLQVGRVDNSYMGKFVSLLIVGYSYRKEFVLFQTNPFLE